MTDAERDELNEKLLREQQRTNALLEKIYRQQPSQQPERRRRMCPTGRQGHCYGPWYVCAIFGCAIPGWRR